MKFKVGDSVAYYTEHGRKTAIVVAVEESNNILWLSQHPECYQNDKVHPKQCRKLVKKERRSIWVHKDTLAWIENAAKGGKLGSTEDCIEFVEVKKK